MNHRICKYFKWVLPILFVVYYSNIAVFMHTHMEDGTIVVHSHPFSKADGGASHQHKSLTEIFFFHNLSTVNVADGSIQSLQLQLFIPEAQQVAEGLTYTELLTAYSKHLFLRGPPVLG